MKLVKVKHPHEVSLRASDNVSTEKNIGRGHSESFQPILASDSLFKTSAPKKRKKGIKIRKKKETKRENHVDFFRVF